MAVSGRILGLATGLTFLLATPALAVQTNHAPEGLYAHQLGHALFAAALVFLYVRMAISPLATGPGWRQLRLACVFFFLWNMATLASRWLEEIRQGPLFSGGEGLWSQTMTAPPSWLDVAAYALSFDHLLGVPAMILFVVGLSRLAREGT